MTSTKTDPLRSPLSRGSVRSRTVSRTGFGVDSRSARPVAIALAALLLLAPLGPAIASEPQERSTGLLGLRARRLAGSEEALARYAGQVLLIVNTASRCGYTPQYEGLQALYDRYRAQGFSVLGFPSNDFAGQEPGSDREIGSFCRMNYGVEFPMFSKVEVGGADAHPVYGYLTSLPAPVGGPVQWNFQKYLVDREGRVVARYAPRTEPSAPELVSAIERLLAEPAPDRATDPAAGAEERPETRSPRRSAGRATGR